MHRDAAPRDGWTDVTPLTSRGASDPDWTVTGDVGGPVAGGEPQEVYARALFCLYSVYAVYLLRYAPSVTKMRQFGKLAIPP